MNIVAMQTLVYKLCELGWLYQHISLQIIHDTSLGVIRQSFYHAVQTELMEYYQLLSLLEENHSSKDGKLTLKRLVVWTQEPMERLRYLATLMDAVTNLTGGALLSGVFAYLQHGNVTRTDFVLRLVTPMAIPLLHMIRCWILEGVLNDTTNEFFIVKDTCDNDKNVWKHQYVIRDSMRPGFIPSRLALQILCLGKSINFIRQCPTSCTWSLDPDTVQLPSQVFSSTLERSIQTASDVTNAQVLYLLFTQYDLISHCRALKAYLLLGQGDFIQYLMDLLGPELSKRASQIYRYN